MCSILQNMQIRVKCERGRQRKALETRAQSRTSANPTILISGSTFLTFIESCVFIAIFLNSLRSAYDCILCLFDFYGH